MSNGELTLSESLSDVGKKIRAGMDVRFLSISADAGKGYGIYEELHGFAGGAALADHVKEVTAKYHGTPIYAFLENICASDMEKLGARIRREVKQFASSLPSLTAGQVSRTADKFALIGFAGELARRFGVVDWPEGEAQQASKKCFENWVSERGGYTGNLEDQQILSQVKLWFENYGESHFSRWERDDSTIDEHAPRTMLRCGFRRTLHDSNVLEDGSDGVVTGGACSETVYYVNTESFKSVICKGLNVKRAKELLNECGALEGDSKGYSKPVRLPGVGRKPVRVHVIRPHRLPSIGERDNQENELTAA